MNTTEKSTREHFDRIATLMNKQGTLPPFSLALALGIILACVVYLGTAHASEPFDPIDPTDEIFADGFDYELPPWWDCWPHFTPPPPGWVCP